MTTESLATSSWVLRENHLEQARKDYRKHESLMALSNGYLSLRGSFEEENSQLGHAGTYMNGFYEFHDIHYGEKFPGYPEQSQVMINLPDPKSVQLVINGQTFSLDEGQILSYERHLDLHTATLSRSVVWEAPSKEQVRIDSLRFVSATQQHLACLKYSVTALNFAGRVELHSFVALDRCNISRADDPRIGVTFNDATWRITQAQQDQHITTLHGMTTASQLPFHCAVAQVFSGGEAVSTHNMQTDTAIGQVYSAALQTGETLSLTKYMWYDRHEVAEATAQLQALQAQGFDALLAEHQAWWQASWESMDVAIEGAASLQQALRFNMFHLTQAVGKDGYTNISAKGMTGEGYEGHYFWDTEIYMIPFFLYTQPEIAKQLLLFRYHTLDGARARARELGHARGALYPWRTINGNECSAYYPAGTAQYHINADIAYAIRLYYQVTGDREFMQQYGLEMLLEMSTLWLDFGVFDPEKDGAFCIQEVTGPDEYTCLVNNNLYTNVMVKSQLSFTLDCLQQALALSERAAELAQQFDQKKAETAIERMYLPYSERLQIHAQDDSFLSRPVWDIANTPRNKFPLLMHFHPLTLYRHQVCKQADVVLAEVLLPDAFSAEQKQRDFDYYEKITTHDSSLSTCIYGIMAAELGRIEQAYNYYIKTARTDLDDFHHNAKDGIHAANMAGSWLGLVYGFAGMRLMQDGLHFAPRLPPAWTGYSFSVTVQGKKLRVQVRAEQVSYHLVIGDTLSITHHGEPLILTHGKDITVA